MKAGQCGRSSRHGNTQLNVRQHQRCRTAKQRRGSLPPVSGTAGIKRSLNFIHKAQETVQRTVRQMSHTKCFNS